MKILGWVTSYVWKNNAWSNERLIHFIGSVSSVIGIVARQVNGRKHAGVAEALAGDGEQQAVTLEMVLESLTMTLKELDGDGRGMCCLTLMWVVREM